MHVSEQFAAEYFQWLKAIVNRSDRWLVYQRPKYAKLFKGQLADETLMSAGRGGNSVSALHSWAGKSL